MGLRVLKTLGCADAREQDLSRKIVQGYVGHLEKAETREAAECDLGFIAQLIAGPGSECTSICWWKLDYLHVDTIRGLAAESVEVPQVDRCLCVLRGILRNMWQNTITSEDRYLRVASILHPVGDQGLYEGQMARWGDEFDSRVDLDEERVLKERMQRS